jgi:hypothetical protein
MEAVMPKVTERMSQQESTEAGKECLIGDFGMQARQPAERDRLR